MILLSRQSLFQNEKLNIQIYKLHILSTIYSVWKYSHMSDWNSFLIFYFLTIWSLYTACPNTRSSGQMFLVFKLWSITLGGFHFYFNLLKNGFIKFNKIWWINSMARGVFSSWEYMAEHCRCYSGTPVNYFIDLWEIVSSWWRFFENRFNLKDVLFLIIFLYLYIIQHMGSSEKNANTSPCYKEARSGEYWLTNPMKLHQVGFPLNPALKFRDSLGHN